ncbi:hypothetical protein ACQ4PT_007597 [Festuca glaucescens]
MGQQEDAHEFLSCLLENLQKCTLDPKSIDGESIVEQVFGGRLKSLVDDLVAALESFTKVEQLGDAENKLNCENCNGQVWKDNQLVLDKAPDVLAFQLKRFTVTHDGYIEKIDKHVEYPSQLDLQLFHSNPGKEGLQYDLYGVVKHFGLPNFGQYVCTIRSSPTSWHLMNDSLVDSITKTSALNQEAYLLFYVRQGMFPWFSSLLQEANSGAPSATKRMYPVNDHNVFAFENLGAYRRPDIGYYSRTRNADPKDDSRVAWLLADPASSRLEELIIACEHRIYERQYFPPLAPLPCAATLRVLELDRCYLQPTSRGLAFPRLTDLTLRDCTLLEGYLQDVVDAAPAVTSLTLVNVSHKPPVAAKDFNYMSNCFGVPLRLRCPMVTALVLRIYLSKHRIGTERSTDVGSSIELDMPNLRSFLYQGYAVKLLLTSPALGLSRVDLDDTHRKHYVHGYVPPPGMLTGFSSTRTLKLRLVSIEDIVADGVILPTFPNLELLELDGKYGYRNRKTAEAVVRLLRSCPAMSELRLRLDMQYDYFYEQKIKDQAGGPFGESMDRFERLAPMSAARRCAVELDEVSEIPSALTNNCAFSCLENSLRKVTLQFTAKEVNCFQAQLAKFLVENAMVLEEMHIEDGSQFWPDHLCNKVARWRAESFKRKNLPDTAASFRVYQLANHVVDSKE